MKRIILLLTAALMVGTMFAQTSTQINFGSIQKKLEKSNAEIEHAKKSQKYKTWLNRGELMLEVYDAMLLNANPGMSMAEFTIIVGTPKEKNEKEVEGQMVTEVIMDRVTFYFVDDVLEYWVFTDKILEDPLSEAYTSFQKSQELDEKGRATSKIGVSLNRLKYIYISEGSNCYTQKKYDCSLSNFAKAIEIGEHPSVNFVDTVVIFYAGLSAQVGLNYEDAVTYYKKALEYDFTSDGNVYYNIFEAYTAMGKDEEGLKYLEEGFLEYPNNQSILYGLINYYISKGDNPEVVLDYIHKAMEVEPDEFSLHFAEGTLHDRLGNFEEAEKSYKKSIELNPDYYDALFNLGALYFNAGVELLEQANKVPAREVEKYDELIEKSNAKFRLSIPYIERAYEASPEKAAIETLRNLYFRFRNDSEEMQKKYDKINEVWDNLEE